MPPSCGQCGLGVTGAFEDSEAIPHTDSVCSVSLFIDNVLSSRLPSSVHNVRVMGFSTSPQTFTFGAKKYQSALVQGLGFHPAANRSEQSTIYVDGSAHWPRLFQAKLVVVDRMVSEKGAAASDFPKFETCRSMAQAGANASRDSRRPRNRRTRILERTSKPRG